jgi:uncharacterized protein YdhG (YjbR/CyaY superfamily)
MAERNTATKGTRKSAKGTNGKASVRFTDEERAAMKERAKELKTAARRSPRDKAAEGERDVLEKISEMEKSDREMAEKIHAIIKANAPDLMPRTWYGMPAYSKDGSVLCFFRPAPKFNERYATFGFNDNAKLDDGNMWPVAYALKKLTKAEEAKITALIKQAVS